MFNKLAEFIDDHFFDTFVVAKVYDIFTAKLQIYQVGLGLVSLYLFKRYRDGKRKRNEDL